MAMTCLVTWKMISKRCVPGTTHHCLDQLHVTFPTSEMLVWKSKATSIVTYQDLRIRGAGKLQGF
uniref:Uncharacterized protein n=1 Tax=Arundo donax TaxID=35708 RepID=A0A0A9HYT5_ARUDO